jgi:hypothetical protein
MCLETLFVLIDHRESHRRANRWSNGRRRRELMIHFTIKQWPAKNAVGRLPYRVALWSDAQIAPSPTAALIQFSATFLRVPVPQNAAYFQGIWTGLT